MITNFVNFNKDSDHKTVDTSELRARFMSNVLSLKEVVLWILSPPFVCCFWSEKNCRLALRKSSQSQSFVSSVDFKFGERGGPSQRAKGSICPGWSSI